MLAVVQQTVTQSTSTLVIIAVIGLFSATIAAVVPIVVLGRQRKATQLETWAREDRVALRAQHVAAQVEEVRIHQEKSAAEANAKMDLIVHQTDGLYTAALESELRALVNQTATLREVVALRVGTDASADNDATRAVIAENDKQISLLKSTLERRIEYQAALTQKPLSALHTGDHPIQVEIVNPDPVDVAVVPPPQDS